ncbi:MAG: arsenic resistance N-acetyltransferase ArsN2 [Promethearchaeota archaeon]
MADVFPIESASTEDIHSVVVLLQDVELPPDGIEPHIENFLIIRSPHAVTGPQLLVGCIGLELYNDAALLRSFAIHPDFQKRGLGERLYLEVIEKARHSGIKNIYLLTDTAEEYFRKRGFEEIDRENVPASVRESIEFTTLCPAATVMKKTL